MGVYSEKNEKSWKVVWSHVHAALFAAASVWVTLVSTDRVSEQIKCGVTCIMGYYSVFKRKENSVFCDNIDDPQKHCVMWNLLDVER